MTVVCKHLVRCLQAFRTIPTAESYERVFCLIFIRLGLPFISVCFPFELAHAPNAGPTYFFARGLKK